MDEPTSVLTPQAVLTLFETLRRLASEGCSILYISHKLDEIQRLCDSATVLRSGRVSGTTRIPNRKPGIAGAPDDRQGVAAVPTRTPERRAKLRLKSINSSLYHRSLRHPLKNISLEVRSGEMLGIAGVSGNGQKELLGRPVRRTACVAQHDAIQLCGTRRRI